MGRVLSTHFSFDTTWQVAASPERVAEVLTDLAAYPHWWPQVRAVADLGHDRAWVVCRSRLPYTLDLVLTAVRREPPLLHVDVAGDLEGWVRIGLEEESGGTHVAYEQEVDVTGPAALAARVLRPAAVWNHRWMVAGMQRGLAEVLRQRGLADGARGP